MAESPELVETKLKKKKKSMGNNERMLEGKE